LESELEELGIFRQGDSRGCQILLLLGSANRDETVFPDGTSFEISRGNARNHLSFG
jgi:cytochrome P450